MQRARSHVQGFRDWVPTVLKVLYVACHKQAARIRWDSSLVNCTSNLYVRDVGALVLSTIKMQLNQRSKLLLYIRCLNFFCHLKLPVAVFWVSVLCLGQLVSKLLRVTVCDCFTNGPKSFDNEFRYFIIPLLGSNWQEWDRSYGWA